MKMSHKAIIFPEPKIEFRYGQSLEDPHQGLSLFGAYDVDSSTHPKNINYGLLGTKGGIKKFKEFTKCIAEPVISDSNRNIWPTYPGFDVAFGCEWPLNPSWIYSIDEQSLISAIQNYDPNIRAREVVDLYLKGIEIVSKRDEEFDVLICVVPDEVWKSCRPKSFRPPESHGPRPHRKKKMGTYMRTTGQMSLSDKWKPDDFRLSTDFRRQIKARSMQYGMPIQLLRESTLELSNEADFDRRGLTALSDRAWNLSTALYYKAGGKPWKLSTAREGVCYIGISFRLTKQKTGSKTACCAAQMFLDSGDGIVFLGEEGPWYSPEEHQFHLTREAAKRLLEGVLKTYQDQRGKNLKEIFLHSRSAISEEEFSGYLDACPKNAKVVGINVRSDIGGPKLFRAGKMPVLRGTFVKWNDDFGYLWASGFKPALGTYDGFNVPNPLKIQVQYGDASIEDVAKDIFGLTKLNYNACKLGNSEPVTIKFSDAVGEILVSNPAVKQGSPNFKYYI
jgi:hypothetical protein